MKVVNMYGAAALAVALSQSGFAQERIPVRALTPPTAVSSETFGAILGVRELPGGRILLNDARKERLLMLDSAMRVVKVILDSISGAPNYYGQKPAPIIAYLDDSSITFDFQAQTLLLIDPAGQVARAMAVPDARAIGAMAGSTAWVDDRGRVVFRGMGQSGFGGSGRTPLMVTTDEDGMKSNADSVPLLRADLQARATDTIATLKNFHARRVAIDTINGLRGLTVYSNPLQNGDEWTMMSDGTVAIVRGQDYHIDFITQGGQVTHTPKLPFDWKRIEEPDKQRILDSARVRDSTDQLARANGRNGTGDVPVRGSAPGAAAGNRTGRGGGGADAGTSTTPGFLPGARARFVSAKELPDYFPPIRSGAVRGDLDGNVWILPTTSSESRSGDLVYDVVNRKGVLFERVRLPAGRVVAGFGRGGVVYLMSGSLAAGFRLERVRIVGR